MDSKSLLVIIVVMSVALMLDFVEAHPFCPSQQPPEIPSPALELCRPYNQYPGSCCNQQRLQREVWYPRGRILASKTSAARKCRNILGNLLCASCNPYAAHIFGGEGGEPQTWPYLCMPFCQRFYSACADIPINTNARIYVPIRIPGVSAGNGTRKIRDSYPTAQSYCSRFGSVDRGSCHTDKPAEPFGPPPSAGRVVKLSQPFPNINLSRLVVNNRFTNARHHIVDLKFIPGSSPARVAVVFQTGHIVTFLNRASVSSFDLLLDISDRIYYKEPTEVGLMGVEFDPNFATNRYFYVKYTRPTASLPINNIVVSRLRASASNLYATVSPSTERILLDIPRPGIHHHSGPPVFSSDGLMYIPIGDGTTCCGPRELVKPSRTLTNLLGKILRIDTRESASRDNDDSGPLYMIPPSNPFANAAGAVRKEIWATGFRNPWRITWDSVNSNVWLGDVGEKAWEEVNYILSGRDYGWNEIEGNECFRTPNCSDHLNPSTYTAPVYVHPHPDKCGDTPCISANAVIGGYWYKGTAVPTLVNKYIYGDWFSGKLFSLSVPDRSNPLIGASVTRMTPNFSPPISGEFAPAAFAQDSQGEIYVTNWASPQIFKITEDLPMRSSSAYAQFDGVDVPETSWFGMREASTSFDEEEAADEEDDSELPEAAE